MRLVDALYQLADRAELSQDGKRWYSPRALYAAVPIEWLMYPATLTGSRLHYEIPKRAGESWQIRTVDNLVNRDSIRIHPMRETL